MADFDTKFMEMQKYLPFLQNVIEKLRSSSDQDDGNPRRAQLKKMEVLHDLLKSNKKKLRMETLLKCEGLLLKLASKMERIPFLQSETETSKPTNHTSNPSNTTTMSNLEVPSKSNRVSSVDIVDITGPESPPPQPLEEVPPVVIPTERRGSPTDGAQFSRSEQRDRHKYDSKHERNYKHHDHQHGIHQSREHNQQYPNLNRSSNNDRDRSSDVSKIFNRRCAGTGSARDSANLNVNTINRDNARLESQRNRDPRASSSLSHEIYSPEECWDDFAIKTTVSQSSADLIDSPAMSRLEEARYHDTIFNFKKNMPKSSEMFSRVRNPERIAKLPGRSAPISIPVKVPTIPEVLKSPPLSASDISDLLSESDGNATEKSIPSISEIGSRRPVKLLNNIPGPSSIITASDAATLDKVRKKFAIVTQGSPQRRDSPDILKSPVATGLKDMHSSLPNERVALKYNPHPRTERNTYQNSSDAHSAQPADPRLNPNRFSSAIQKPTPASPTSTFNSAVPHDPRLRKAATTCPTANLYQQPQTSQHNSTPLHAHINKKVSFTAGKPSVRQSHIPSLMESTLPDPRASLSPNFPSGSIEPRQQLQNSIPVNQSQVGIFSRRDFPVNVVQTGYGGPQALSEFASREKTQPQVRPTTQRSKSGYSSEENWDSDSDTPPVVQKVATQAPQIPPNRTFKEYVKSGNDVHVNSGFRAGKPPLLPSPVCGRPIVGKSVPPIVNPHLHRVSPVVPHNPHHSKFSALLNDKTERSKYFESKKKKQSEPRTYMEYKQAKARAAAEEAARKAAEETAKASTATGKDIGEVSELDSSVLAKLSENPPAVSTLDKLYRNTDFSNCAFPKAKTSFKIPKKATEKPADKSEGELKIAEKKEKAKENKSEPQVTEQQQKEQTERNIDNAPKNKKEEKQLPTQSEKKKVVAKNQAPKKDPAEVNEKKAEKKMLNKEVAKDGKETHKKMCEKVKKKVANQLHDTNESGPQEISQPTEPEREIIRDNTGKTVSTAGGNLKVVSEAPQNFPAKCSTPADTSNEQKKVNTTEQPLGTESTVDVVTESQEPVEHDLQTPILDNSAQEEIISNKIESESPPSALSSFLDKLCSAEKPARISKRRNTMVVRGSLPEVDKEKIFTFKSLVYEDIQGAKEEERRKQLDAKLPKKNKCLAEIFQKTDDNCKVSTQNIISGKRRTRTNVNFNEVQRSLEIFQRKRRSEPLKTHSEKASPVVKKMTPKGKKGAKGKVNETIDKASEQSLDEVGSTEKAEAEESVKPTKRIAAKAIKKEPLLDEVKSAKGATVTPNEETEAVKQTPTEAVEKSAKPSRIDVLMEEDAQKRHLLESFVQDILNPKKDKAQIFTLLSQILSEDNLKFVKEIVESQAEKNAAKTEETNEDAVGEDESAISACEDLNKPNEVKEKQKSEHNDTVHVAKPPKVKGKMKKKNELDRLNEDIRTMFISQGVLTATGRRMCTLVAAAEQAGKDSPDTSEKPNQAEVEPQVKDKAQTSAVSQIIPRIRKSKVVLHQLNVEEYQRQSKRYKKAKKTEAEESADESESQTTNDGKTEKTPPRKMPVLKPHTPIKQSEVEDDSSDELADEEPVSKKLKLEEKVKKIKPGPKSKKPKAALLSDDEEVVVENDIASEKATVTANKLTVIKNTNKEWHSQSKWTKWCVLCDTKIAFPATHYRRSHGEYYASRLSPDILEKFKMGKMSKPFFGVSQKKLMYWSYRCPFCLQHNRTLQSSWAEHLITHTGEYFFECSDCHLPSCKAGQVESHIKAKCVGATVVRKNTIPHGPVLLAHVCHLCNFIQLNRQNLDNHFIEQHVIAKSKIAKLGYTIDLFDTRDVQIVDGLKAVMLETRILNEGLEREDVAEDEEAEVEANETDEQCNTSLAELNTAENPSESVDSDDIPIAKSVQNKQNLDVKKLAVEKALRSNVFVPTRESNESPTMNNFAQSLFTIANEQPDVKIGGVAVAGTGSGISMAERLSQRFKNIQSGKAGTAKPTPVRVNTTTASANPALTVLSLPSAPLTKVFAPIEVNRCAPATQNNAKTSVEVAPLGFENSTIENQLNSSSETAFSTITESVSVETEKRTTNEVTTSATETAVDSPIEDDDDNWEDIEITESAPSTTSSVVSAASSTTNKNTKIAKKNVFHKLNRLYVTNNKLKKSLSITIGSKKKPTEERKEVEGSKPTSNENATSNVIVNGNKTNAVVVAPASTPTLAPPNVTVEIETVISPNAPPPLNLEPTLGFRPLITNLDDLLPDSPLNDPIELVPELTPMESLQDLCDVSSILNSDYMSDNWEPNTTPLHLNNDSQQANMEEALDFVKEQQLEQSIAATATATATNAIGSLMALASINRIQNIGYSKSIEDNTFKFYCLSENCTFLYSSEAIGLESHFSCEHSQSRWNGYCYSCKAQVCGVAGVEQKFLLSAELNHMRTKHLTTSTITSTIATADELKQPSKSNSPALDDERPRIKIRRLTGDCLSTTPTPTSALSSKSVTIFDENAQLAELATEEQRPSPTISTSFLNKIQPTVEKPVENRHFENIGAQAISSPGPPSTAVEPAATPPCQLQIASVVSLKESGAPSPATPSVQLPVISNVCSLNARSVASPTNKTGSLWAQHIADERVELERSAAESLEVSRILNSGFRRTTPGTRTDENSTTNDSPEPQVVAETVPVAQATSGNYLITQTVSAQYEEGRLGFNISIAANPSLRLSRSDSASSASTSSAVVSTVPQFKCMANGCKYQTRLPLAMGDHLQFHDRQNFSTQREYLRCSQCSHLAEDVDGFIQHTEQKHGMLMRSATDTETIRRILRNPDSNGSQQSSSGKQNNDLGLFQTFTQQTWETALKEVVSATGVPDSKLFRCTIEDCKTKLSETSYYSHVVYHLSTLGQLNINTHSYKCPHCKSAYQKPQKIKTHIKTHGIHRYFCYLCTTTAINIDQMYKHFEEKHWRAKKLRSTPLPYKASDKPSSSNSYFVLFTHPLDKYEIQQFREKLIAEWHRKKTSSRTQFKPSEISLLPLTPIFDKILNCAVCAYKTKVRTNLMRHLQMHTDDNNCGTQHVTNVDPINPVPCLNSSEKHFDKMTNLASSSLVVGSTTGNAASTANGGSNTIPVGVKGKVLYEYVPDAKRYTCGVMNCQYLTISDDIFRSHLNALHSDIIYYNCPHCKEEICKRNLSVERILSHLRFHGPKLYQCESCGYLHYMRNVVDRHIRQHDVHPPLFVKVIEYDRKNDSAGQKPESAVTPAAPIAPAVAKQDTLKSRSSKHKWSCNLCGHKTMTQQQMVAHATSQHSCKHQYQCMHCAFTAVQLVQVMTHIDEKHSGKKREARYVFEKMEEQDNSNSVNTTDTRPLWQRDDPTRVRHIRGILMEDEEESERYRKRLCLDDNDEGTENGDSDENLNLNQFGFLCYYCNMQPPSFEDLREKHWQASNCKKFDAMKPFRHRICTQLKCPHCLSFKGNSLDLIGHMKELHQATKYLAADAYATAAGLTCGHCEYRGQSLTQLAQHTTRLRHKPLDLKAMSLAQLEKLKALGSPLSYVQCLSCMELLANEIAFEEHKSLVHPNDCDIRSLSIHNKLIYSCPLCPFTSQTEMTVLRHMIDHYSGFKRCYFCGQPQTSFNGYMQHCYSDHREEIKNFCYIYTSTEISKYLQQMQLIFPNGLTVDLCNLRLTQCLQEYGNKHIKLLYDEIQKTSQQPPIPRLSLGRLVARKSIEAKLAEACANSPTTSDAASASTAAALQLAGNNAKALHPTSAAKKITKRRSTIALGREEYAIARFSMNAPMCYTNAVLFNNKKRKTQQNLELLPPPAVVRQAVVVDNENVNFPSVSDYEEVSQSQPFSYYGQTPTSLDLNKIFIKIAAADTVQTKISISKFKLLYNITPRVVVTPTDMSKYRNPKVRSRKTVKPCPASHKIRYS